MNFHYRNGTITLFKSNGDFVTVNKGDGPFDLVKQALTEKKSEAEILKLLDTKQAVSALTKGKFNIVGDKVYYDGKEVHGMAAKRAVEYLEEGIPMEPLTRFIENVNKNISFNSRREAFDFVDRCNLPLTEDGCFIGYKGVNSNFYDKWSGTIDNSVGLTIKKDRADVDDNVRKLCSYGLHVGSYDYATGYAGSGGVVVLVKVNPRDVVSVANDACQNKIRVCEYQVVGVMERELERPAYAVNNTEINEVKGAWDDVDEDDWAYDEVTQYFGTPCQQGGCGCSKPEYTEKEVKKPVKTQTFHSVRDSKGRFTKKQ